MIQTSVNIQQKTKRNFRSKEQWRELIDAFENNDLSTADFCEQHGIAQSGFYNWRKKFRDEAQAQTKTALIELPHAFSVAPTDPHPWDVELELGSGMILRMRGA